MKRKKETDIIVSFLGNSKNDVTGSSVLINIPRKDKTRYNILLEMGMAQSNNQEKDIAVNRKILEQYNKELVQSIETVFVAHVHQDHTALLPYLDSQGFDGNIVMSKKSVETCKDLIENSVDIHLGEIQRIKATKGKRITPLYSKENYYNICERFEYREVDKKYRLNDEVEFRFINSGHVYGGCMIELWITKPNGQVKKITYTSDLGSDYNNEWNYFVPKREQISKTNLLISEATYNNPERSWSRKEATEERKQLKIDLLQDLNNGKDILFSGFSLGRVQNILCMLYDFYKNDKFPYDVILDGVLLHKINNDYLKTLDGEEYEYFKRVLEWSRLKLVKDYSTTMAILKKREPRIVISTSGFLSNGRIIAYLKSMLGCSKSVIYISGYCGSKDSIGYRILNPNQKTVTIDKVTILKRAEVRQLKTMSSHIQFDELISMFKGVTCEKILIHHSGEGKEEFVNMAKKELMKVGNTTNVIAVNECANQFIL